MNYYPSRIRSATCRQQSRQDRTLTNWGVKADVSYVNGRHNMKIGTQMMQTRLNENFAFGITDPPSIPFAWMRTATRRAFPRSGSRQMRQGRICAQSRPLPGLPPLRPHARRQTVQFRRQHNINQYAFYIQDSIKFGNLTVQPGLRVDSYHGIVSDSGAQPRVGLSYLVKPTSTVLAGRLFAHL